jgi:hypothetical protein
MYEVSETWLEMEKVFSMDYRLLQRNGLFSVEDVREYIEKYPFEEYSAYRAKYYRHIGPVKYNRIVEALKNAERTLV